MTPTVWPTAPECVLIPEMFHKQVEHCMGEEIIALARTGAGNVATKCDLPLLRQLVIYNICLHTPIAGNA
jgi:hypothetical protein